MALERIVEMAPAYDKRDADPKKNHGICGMQLRFILRGEKGAVQFSALTGIFLPHVADELLRKGDKDYNPFIGMGTDIGYHASEPQYAGQEPRECDLLPGGKCYYDGSSLRAYDFYPTFVSGGSDAVWAMLQQEYRDRFHSET